MPLKDIDLPFEIQYIISFIAVIIGIIALNVVEQKLLFAQTLFGAIIHMILLSLVYLYPRGLKYQPKMVESLKEITKYSLLFVIFSFTYLIVQITLLQLNIAIYICFVIPTIVVIAMGLVMACSMGSLTKGNKIDFLVNPSQIRVYEDYEDDSSVIVKITNDLAKEISLQLKINIPDFVSCNISGQEYNGEIIEKKFKLQGGKGKSFELFFKHNYDDNDVVKVKITLFHNYGKLDEEIILFLRS